MSQSFGVINVDGSVGNPGSDDWHVQKASGQGVYNVSFAYPRAHVPVVVAGAYSILNDFSVDNVFSVYGVTEDGFKVVSSDVAGNIDPGGDLQDAAFSFIAMW